MDSLYCTLEKKSLASSCSTVFLIESLVKYISIGSTERGGSSLNSNSGLLCSIKRTHLSDVITCHSPRKWVILPPTGTWGRRVGKCSSSCGSSTTGGVNTSRRQLLSPLWTFCQKGKKKKKTWSQRDAYANLPLDWPGRPNSFPRIRKTNRRLRLRSGNLPYTTRNNNGNLNCRGSLTDFL